MTSNGLTQLWPILEAFQRKQTIQIREAGGAWADVSPNEDVGFNLSPDRYRVKPAPRRFRLAVRRDEVLIIDMSKAYPEAVLKALNQWEFIDVIEDIR